MSSSNSTLAEIAYINFINVTVSQVLGILLISLGLIGHSLNIYIFTRPILRDNPCVRYFLASTFSGMLSTYVNVPLRVLQQVYNIDAPGYSDATCKTLTFLLFWSRYCSNV